MRSKRPNAFNIIIIIIIIVFVFVFVKVVVRSSGLWDGEASRGAS
jgi:uncharacterized protein (DUF983 family)|tara:strand:- start:422 stop:556 length:135 start_codon:yes stop_codon:yes gene_type:complete